MSNTNPNEEGEEVVSSTSPSKDEISIPAKILRRGSRAFSESRPPVGMFAAYGHYASAVPTMDEIQQGKFGPEGWSGPGQRRNSAAHRPSDFHVLNAQARRKSTVDKKAAIIDVEKVTTDDSSNQAATSVLEVAPHDPSVPYPNGYQFPPKHSKWKATTIALRGFWNYFLTPVGFLITIYSLNVVAWGGMLFLILCHATPAMAHPSYNDLYSGAKIWLEIDSQILNALFCVTGLGLIPWRFRDLYYLLQWRWRKNYDGLRHLAGIHRGWFRLQGSQELDPMLNFESDQVPANVSEAVLALPVKLTPSPPLTGERAPPSAYWKLDFVIWAFVINTFLQIMLCGFMWGENRFHRPGWVVGLLISIACIVAMSGGWYIFAEGKRVKKVEGVPVSKEDQEILNEMRARELASSSSNTV